AAAGGALPATGATSALALLAVLALLGTALLVRRQRAAR
ncbi:MAG: hypothetical protein JWM62_2704, partial [Frankiales bacterium]|nr:hypothetical protein [Frankiales bacterium]